MTRSVLCAVDVSNGDDDIAVLQRAAQLAALDDAQLDVIAVVPDFGISQVGAFFGADRRFVKSRFLNASIQNDKLSVTAYLKT